MVDKNLKKEQAKKMRVYYSLNMGTISHKTAKYPSRQRSKMETKRRINEEF